MKAFLLALVATAVITVGMNQLLTRSDYTEWERVSAGNVRLD